MIREPVTGDRCRASAFNHQSSLANHRPITHHRLQVSIGTAVAVLLCTAAAAAAATDTRFEQVSLLNAGDRVSLVFELTGEPQNVATRRVSAAVLELDAGPVAAPPTATSFMAPAGVRYVMGVSIHGGATGSRGVLKARITLLERARSSVRVVGRRVYVDFIADAAPPPATPVPRPVRQRPAATAPAEALTPSTESTPAAAPSAGEAYQAAVQPAVERFEQLGPFLISAAASPSESVLKAIGSTVTGIHGLLLSVEVPDEARDSHALLLSAVAAATKAADPSFDGDRSAQARQALSLLQKVQTD